MDIGAPSQTWGTKSALQKPLTVYQSLSFMLSLTILPSYCTRCSNLGSLVITVVCLLQERLPFLKALPLTLHLLICSLKCFPPIHCHHQCHVSLHETWLSFGKAIPQNSITIPFVKKNCWSHLTAVLSKMWLYGTKIQSSGFLESINALLKIIYSNSTGLQLVSSVGPLKCQ